MELLELAPMKGETGAGGIFFSELLSIFNKCVLAWEKCLYLLMTVLLL